MYNLITMDSKTWVTSLCKDFDPNEFQYVVISRDIKSNNSSARVISLTGLCPPTETVLSKFIEKGFCKAYKKGYANVLKDPKNIQAIANIVEVLFKGDKDIIFMCSPREKEYKYLKLLTEHISKKFGIKIIKYKEFKEDPKKEHNDKKTRKNALLKAREDKKALKKSNPISNQGKEYKRIEYFSAVNFCTDEQIKDIAINIGHKKKDIKNLSRSQLIDLLLGDEKDGKKKKKKKK